MPPEPGSTEDLLETKVMKLLDDATSMSVGMSEDDSVYDLGYITQKLVLITRYAERLSDIQMQLTRISIEVIRTHRNKAALAEVKLKQARATDDYGDMPLHEKGFWLERQLADTKADAEKWKQLEVITREVKEAVADRASMMRRLDSDLRLHARIYEAKVAAGATSPGSYTGNATKEIEL